MIFVVRIDLVQYTLGMSGNFNPRLVSPKYLRYIFVSLCSDNSLHLNPGLAIPKLQRARRLPPPVKSRHVNARGTPEPKEPPQIGGGTFVTYPTFRTNASLSHGSPLPSHPPTHSYTEAANTRDETPHPAPSATQPEPLPRRRRPQQHLNVPHPPYQMRIRRRYHHPAGSAPPSSTSKELPRRSPRLSRHLHSHTAVFTCTTGRASSSPFPRMKLRPNRRHQTGCTLIAAFSS